VAGRASGDLLRRLLVDAEPDVRERAAERLRGLRPVEPRHG
jgi:hypothetical protein